MAGSCAGKASHYQAGKLVAEVGNGRNGAERGRNVVREKWGVGVGRGQAGGRMGEGWLQVALTCATLTQLFPLFPSPLHIAVLHQQNC